MSLTTEKIEKLIKERKDTYSIANNAVPAFNHEQQLSKEYNGRQILELIQNADDANAQLIIITLDTKNQQLIIYNDGVPFDYNGIRSILIANYSSKVSSNYIGNKGLGFRSLIVWADEIQIASAGFTFTFSHDIALKQAHDLRLDIERIRQERNLSEDCCPFPILGIPEYKQMVSAVDTSKGCTITLKYKEKYEDDIKSQLEQIDEKTLLFLKQIQEVDIKYEDSQSIPDKTLKIVKNTGYSIADGIEWKIIETDNELPEEYQVPSERKCYEIKLAIPSQLQQNKKYKLYNYLPTAEELALPFIIHATLDLGSSRKHLNDNKVNKYILEKVAECISSHVDSMLDSPNGWKAYEMMTPHNPSSSEIINDSFYKRLRELRDQKMIFPTIGGTYVKKEEYFFYSQEDSEFWSDFSVKKAAISKILLPLPDSLDYSLIEKHVIPNDDYVDSLNQIFNSSLELPERARLIYHVVNSHQISDGKKLSSVFVDDNSKLITDPYTYIFTPQKEGMIYELPKFAKISFINHKLYEIVLNRLKEDNLYEAVKGASNEPSDSRIFSTILKRITHISDYDKNDVIRVIIKQTNKSIDIDSSHRVSIIKEMVRCLYAIYRKTGDLASYDNVKLLNQQNEVIKASELLFLTTDNQYVFGSNKNDYLLEKELWDIEFEDDDYPIFMKSLGVNQMTKRVKVSSADALFEYANYLISIHEFEEDEIHKRFRMVNAMINDPFIQISDLLMKKIKSLSLEKIIYLLATNNELFKLVCNSKETLKFQYRQLHYIETDYSLLRYQFLKLESVRNKILSSEVVLDNLEEEKIAIIDLDKRNSVLLFLATNLRGENEDEIASIVNQLETSKYPRKNIRKVYKTIIDALSEDNRTLKDKEIRLHAYVEGGVPAYFSVKDVFYSDNTSLPKGLLSAIRKHRLYYTTRQGAKKVCTAFGIDPLENFVPTLLDCTLEIHDLNDDFTSHFKEMKPYLLLYCVQNLDSMKKKRELANQLKRSEIILVTQAGFRLNEQDTLLDLNPTEFIRKENAFYLNADGTSSLSNLQNSVDYCNAITEILSIITKLEGKDDTFVRIFQNLAFMKQSANLEFTEDERIEVKSLIGISQEEATFWKKVLDLDLSDMSEKEIHEKALELMQQKDFPFHKVDYQHWLTDESIELLETIQKFNNDVLQFVDLTLRQRNEFEDTKRDYKNIFIHSLWKYLSKEESDQQQNYIKYQQEYDGIIFSGVSNQLYTSNEYVLYLKERVGEIINSSDFTWEEQEEQHKCLYPKYESAMLELPIEEQSLLYFNDYEALIESFVQRSSNLNDEIGQETLSSLDNDIKKSKLIIVNANRLSKINLPKKEKTRKSGIQRNHTLLSDRHKRKAGKAAELLVKKLLDIQGYVYHWRSGYSDEANKDDTLGYDFEYKKNNESEWRFLEVKSFNSQRFIVSGHEYDVSQDSEHKGKYDIALVKDGNVYIIKNFFEDDSHYTREAENYSIYCDLPDEFF